MSGDSVANLEWMVVFFCGVLGKIFRAQEALYGEAPGDIKMVTPGGLKLKLLPPTNRSKNLALYKLREELNERGTKPVALLSADDG